MQKYIKDTFYRPGIVSIILNYLLISSSVVFYVFLMLGCNFLPPYSDRCSYFIIISAVIVLLVFVKMIWRTFNRQPMLATYRPFAESVIKFTFFVFQFFLVLVVFASFLVLIFYVSDAYKQYGEKVSLQVFGKVVVPFSILKFIGFLMEYYPHWDLHKLWDVTRDIIIITRDFIIPLSFFFSCSFYILNIRHNKRSDLSAKSQFERKYGRSELNKTIINSTKKTGKSKKSKN